MTREEFMTYVTTIGDVVEFCYDNELTDFTEDIVSDTDFDTYVEDDIREFLSHDYWYNMDLSGIDRGYGYYRRDGILDYAPLDEDEFQDFFDDVVRYCDEYEIWEEEEPEEVGNEQPLPWNPPAPEEPSHQYNIGDVVLVRDDLRAGNQYYMRDGNYGTYCAIGMAGLAGCSVTIIGTNHGRYQIKEDDYQWADGMFAGYAPIDGGLGDVFSFLGGVPA